MFTVLKWLRRLFSAGCLLLLALGLVLLVLYFYLPGYFTARLPALARKAGIQDFTATVRQTGLERTALENIRWGTGQVPVITADALMAEYAPLELPDKKLERMILGGLRLTIAIIDGRPDLTPFQQLFIPPSSRAAPDDTAASPAVMLDEIIIRQSRLTLKTANSQLVLPFNARFTPLADDFSKGRMDLELILCGCPLVLKLNLTTRPRLHLTGRWQTAGLPLGGLYPLLEAFSLPAGIDFSARLDTKGSFALGGNSLALERIDAAAGLTGFSAGMGHYRLSSSPRAGDMMPTRLQFSGPYQNGWRLRINQLALDWPRSLTVSDMDVHILPAGPGWQFDGQTRLTVEAGGWLKEAFSVPLGVTARIENSGKWESQIKARSGGKIPLLIETGTTSLDTALAALAVKARGATPSATTVTVGLKLAAGSLKTAGRQLKFKDIGMDADLTIPRQPAASRLSWQSRTRVSGLQTTIETNRINLATLESDNRGDWPQNSAPRSQGTVFLRNGQIRNAARKLKIEKINIQWPWRWPLSGQTAARDWRIADIVWEDFHFGGVKGRVQQKAAVFTVKGSHRSQRITGLTPKLLLTLDLSNLLIPDITAEITVPPFEIDEKTGIEKWVPALEAVQFNGRLGAKAQARYLGGKLDAAGRVSLSDGRITMPDAALTVGGLSADLTLEDLLAFKSAPHQPIHFDAIHMGDFRIGQGNLAFQLLSPSRFFLETGRFEWAEGHIDVRGFEVSPDMDTIDLVLYADQLKLVRILEQLGLARAEGEGSVNGRIPIRYTDGKFIFDDGFLYSTPGSGGTLNLSAAAGLTAGMDENSAQYTQIDLAREALKSYDYKWVRLRLVTEDRDTLLLRMELDGKPTHTLPFTLDEETGQMVREKEGGPGANFQGIRLDTNFRLPLNQLLEHQRAFKSVMGQ